MMQYIPVGDTINTAKLADVLVQRLILRGSGAPTSRVSDRGLQFTMKF